MLDRKWLFALSIVCSAFIHGFIYVFAPHIKIMGAIDLPPDLAQRFRIQLLDEPAPQQQPPDARPELAAEPGAIRDLLRNEAHRLTPIESLLSEAVDVPFLSERIADEPVEREYELVRDAVVAKTIDAKIIEIAESTARRDVEVARRYVRPSPVRILEEGETPVFRGEIDQAVEQLLTWRKPSAGGSGDDGGETTGLFQNDGPGAGADAGIEAAPDDEGAVELMEHTLASSTVTEAIRRASPYEFMDELVSVAIDAYIPTQGERGFFRLRIAPKEGESIEILPKDVTFIIDASKSIMQRKLDETVEGVNRAIDALRPQDRFNVVVFRDSATRFAADRAPATPENKAAAKAFIAGLERGGETDVYRAIRPVVEQRPREGVPGIVLIVTDGKPTAGLRDGRAIINALTEENQQGNTIYAFGGGRTVNQYLLDLIAYRNKGRSRITEDISAIDRELPAFVGRLQDPILVGLEADYASIVEDEVYPKKIPDFYKGQVVTVYGQFDPGQDNEFVIRLRGLAGEKQKEILFRADLKKAASGNPDIARNWAFCKIYHLIGEMCRVGETPELLGEVRRLSREYNIRTSYDE